VSYLPARPKRSLTKLASTAKAAAQ
jgi:hypothetical protein